jgi:hypothetical protein
MFVSPDSAFCAEWANPPGGMVRIFTVSCSPLAPARGGHHIFGTAAPAVQPAPFSLHGFGGSAFERVLSPPAFDADSACRCSVHAMTLSMP